MLELFEDVKITLTELDVDDADDVVLFSCDVDSMQHLLGVLEEFCHSSGLAVNVEKTKMIVVQTIQPHHCPMLTYRGEHIQFVRSFKYLGIDVPAIANINPKCWSQI